MRILAWGAALYAVALASVITYGKLTFGDLAHHPGPLHMLNSDLWAAYLAYARFLKFTAAALGAYLGGWSAMVGVVCRQVWLGLVLLCGGLLGTALALGLLPTSYGHGYDFKAWLVWLAGGFYFYAGSWLAVTLGGRAWVRRQGEESV